MRKSALRMAAPALGWCLAAHVAAAQGPDQAAMARDLRSGDPDRVEEALVRLPQIFSFDGPRDRYPNPTPEADRAMMRKLTEMNEERLRKLTPRPPPRR